MEEGDNDATHERFEVRKEQLRRELDSAKRGAVERAVTVYARPSSAVDSPEEKSAAAAREETRARAIILPFGCSSC